jgi:uncharacterized membrane protein (UPF0182 family)
MPETIEWPMHGEPSKPKRVGFLIILVLIAVILAGGRSAISYWVDLLWFRSLGYGDVFWRTRFLQWGIFAGFTIATFIVLFGVFSVLKRAHANDMPAAHTIFIGGQQLQLPVVRALSTLAMVVAGLISLAAGTAMAAQWANFALYWFTPQATTGIADPIFHRSLHFYFFTLPVWQIVSGWLLMLAVISVIIAALFLMVTGGARALQSNHGLSIPLAWRGLSITVAFLLAVMACRVYIGRFDLLFAHHTIFDGVTYTDAHVNVTGLLIVCFALLIGAAIALAAGVIKPGGRWLVIAIAPAALCYVGVGLSSWYVTTFIVNPNQLDRERPYIANNIELTRDAYDLAHFTQREFSPATDPDAAEPEKNKATLDNIRLWDVQALRDTLRQVQEIRTYYDFPDIDIDRYQINGSLREVMLGTRELNVDKLPVSSRNWINDKLIYTHGYGITMNTVNGFTPEGLPQLLLSNMPVESTVPSLTVVRPEIYFGEMTNTNVYVNTHQQEFNYPEGQSNNLTNYSGTGGIRMGGFLRRTLLAFDRGDVAKVPFSDDIDSNSRLLMRRNIRERVAALAPFLTYDPDPYMVVGEDGHLTWVIDAFTTSDTYPYSTHYNLQGGSVNYMRNSIKVTIDAFDGNVTFYVFDKEDPLINAWRAIFPSLFKDESQMPDWMQKHMRYPEMMLTLQADAYGLYHMTNPEVFYNREDQWSVATQTSLGDNGEQITQTMEPNFVLMTLPGETNLEFVEILPFTPINRNNMIGWIAARSDGANYGKAVVYNFPKTKLVDGPQQIEARIDQNAQLSSQLTLWNQQGSHVRRGSLLVIPCGRALLYAEPIYLQAQRSPMPELRLVVLALQDKLGYAPTFEGALSALFGSGSSTLDTSDTSEVQQPAPASNGQPQPPMSLNSLIGQAGRDFADYQRLTSQGRLSEAGQKLDDLKRVLDQMSSMQK